MSDSFKGSTGWDFDIPGNTVVQYLLTSQSAGTQTMQIFDPQQRKIVDTSVLSTNLSNTSSGSFPVGSGGKYKIKFPSDHDVLVDTAIVGKGRFVATETALFGGEDSSDGDYNDSFATVTWFNKKG